MGFSGSLRISLIIKTMTTRSKFGGVVLARSLYLLRVVIALNSLCVTEKLASITMYYYVGGIINHVSTVH
jgi:hypothetical protein